MTKAAPIEFQQIGLNAHDFMYSDEKSWRGPCPSCGGHRRFVMFTDHEYPFWHGYCDDCGTKLRAWEKVRVQYDPLQAEQIKAEQARQEAERKEYRKNKLAEFTTAELWAELRDRMTDEHVDWWEAQGIPEPIQKYLSIGFKADKTYRDKNGDLQHSPAYTIPWFGNNFEFKTMQYRLNAPDIADRYRFEYGLAGGGEHYYMADPSEPMKDRVIICEGAKKAIVTWYWLSNMGEFTTIAAASNKTLAPALEATKDCGMRYLILDPDSKRHAFTMAREHKNLKAIYLPLKIDDFYLSGYITRYDFERIVRNA